MERSFEDSSSKLLDSSFVIDGSTFQAMSGSNSTYSTTQMGSPPATISTEDLDMLTTSAIMNSFDHDMLLSEIGTSSIMGISGVDFSPLLENLSSDSVVFPSWNSSSGDHSRFPYQHHQQQQQQNNEKSQSLSFEKEPEKTQKRTSNVNMKDQHVPSRSRHSGSKLKGAIASFDEGKNSIPSTGLGFRRSESAIELSRQMDSSENSDAMDDDEGEKATGKATSKNLVSERRRRKKLNERLYSLRAIVPKISKVSNSQLSILILNDGSMKDLHADCSKANFKRERLMH